MADPVSLAVIGMGAGAAGGGVSALGSLFSGQAQSNMYKYQAGVAQVNATLAKQDADYAEAAGQEESQASGMKTRFQIGQTKAAFGASNVAGPSQNRVVSSEIAVGQENEALIQANAAKRAYGFNVKAAQDTAQAGAYDVAASTSETAGELGAVSSVIGAAGNVASKWLDFSKSFGTGSSGDAFGGSKGFDPGLFTS